MLNLLLVEFDEVDDDGDITLPASLQGLRGITGDDHDGAVLTPQSKT